MQANCSWLKSNRPATVIALALVVVTGCGKSDLPIYRAGGKVVLSDGTPLTAGCVEFRAINAPRPVSARGTVQPDGTFRLGTLKLEDGAVEGEHRALVIVPPPGVSGSMLPGTMSPPSVAIDPRFTRFETSGLKFAVTKDAAKNQFVIRLEKPKSR